MAGLLCLFRAALDYSGLLRGEAVPCFPGAGSLAPLTAGEASLLGGKLVRRTFLVCGLSAFATCFARFFSSTV